MGRFVGRVFEREADGAIGEVIAGATLRFSGPGGTIEARTSSNGTYAAEGPPGRYQVEVTAAGFAPHRPEGFAVLREDRQTFNAFLERDSARSASGVHGRVFAREPDGSIGDPVSGARVAIRRLMFTLTATTDDLGRYAIAVPPGRYDLNARAEGLAPGTTRVVVRNGMTVANLFLLPSDAGDRRQVVEVCDAVREGEGTERTSDVLLPGGDIQELTYQVVDGEAILEGGIVLGSIDELDAQVRDARQPPDAVDDLPESPAPDGFDVSRQALVALASRDRLWEGGMVPFQIDESSSLLRSRVEEAMGHITDNTNIEFIPASSRFDDRVVIRFSRDPAASRADLGRRGGTQEVLLNPRFDVGGIVHELLHALGVFHEQTRNDRDAVVTIEWDNILDGREGNFRKALHRGGADIGPYDLDSVMHYSARAFGKDDPDNPGSRLITIQPVDPSVSTASLGASRWSPPHLSAGDIAGLNRLYPSRMAYDGGHLWGSGNHTTGIAFGDVDGDGRDELIVARRAGGNGRYYVLDDARRDFAPVVTGGSTWGSSAYATCCATGDVDGDGADEVVIGRKASDNHRFQVVKIDVRAGRETRLFQGGDDWGSGNYTTDVAVGVDATGTALIGVARRAGSNARFFVYAGAADGFRLLFRGGTDWGSGNYATGIAFGDVDGDGRLEVGVARRAGSHGRFYVLKDVAGDYTDFRTLHTGGDRWGSSAYATGIAFGDVDGDGRDEVAVSRRSSTNERFFVFDDMGAQFRELFGGGARWGGSNYATAVALGDVDGDGRAELAVTRHAGENARVFLFDDDANGFRPLWEDGRRWGSSYHATCVDLGNARGSGRARHIAVGRNASTNHRFAVADYNP
jgi:hypothetical protein